MDPKVCFVADAVADKSRGGDLQDKSQLFDGSQVNSFATLIYKDREKRIFEFGVRLNPPH